ncbi:MAG: hypothetical protein KDK36_08635 [Leptospiraceae bacterium]|nr:hypothetical protein [Leptospiraceae bacterium]
MKRQSQVKNTSITIHLPIDKDLDNYLSILSKNEERTKLSQIRYILNEYRKNNPIEEI